MRVLFLLLLVSAAAAAEPPATPPPAVRWPLDLPTHYLASNFMEYRDGRFHAGLDLKTNSRTGYPCHAVESGYVSRVRVGYTGYGRAVYLHGVSGRTYVYGHLERLADPLRALVARAQNRRGVYTVDLSVKAGAVPVRAGEVIGTSGQSGTVGPHLHFEVRDAAQRPLDPQLCGFAVDDTRAPRILAVRALPASPEARIAGTATPRLVRGGGDLPPLAVLGPVAFTAQVVETSDAMGHHLAPCLLRLEVDGTEVFAARNDTIEWDRNGQLRLEFLECDDVRERWLHRWPADTVPGRRGGLWYEGPQRHGLAPGHHRCVLTAADRAGNTALATWDLLVLAPEAPWPDIAGGWEAMPTGSRLASPDSPASADLIPPLVPPDPLPAASAIRLSPPTMPGSWRRPRSGGAPSRPRPTIPSPACSVPAPQRLMRPAPGPSRGRSQYRCPERPASSGTPGPRSIARMAAAGSTSGRWPSTATAYRPSGCLAPVCTRSCATWIRR